MDNFQTYYDLYCKRYKKCKSKKDYKKLCKDMILHMDILDKLEVNHHRIFGSMLGEDTYMEGLALAIKMYMLEEQGINCDIIAYSEDPLEM